MQGQTRPSRGGGRHVVVVAVVVVALLAALPAALGQSAPTIVLDPRWAQVGSTVAVEGSGFSPSSRCGDVEITFDDELVATATASDAGTFSATFTVPEREPDRYLVVARHTSPNCPSGVARETLEVFTFAVSPNSGPVGSSTTASGAGFPDATECGNVTIRFDDEVVANVATEGFPGDPFSVDVTVPARPTGSYVVEAFQDGCGTRRGTDTFRIPPQPTDPPTPTEPPTPGPTEPPAEAPTLSIDPEEGPIETEATATGTEYDDGVPVEVRFGDVAAATVPGGDVTDGSFTAPLVVPEGVPGGPTVVTACQRCGTDDERVATTTFLVTPRLFLDPAVGPPGLVTRAHGDGFPAAVEVNLAWRPGIGTMTTTTDEVGLLRAFVLVIHRDRLGIRELVATVSDEDATTVAVPYVVVPGSSQPRGFSFRR